MNKTLITLLVVCLFAAACSSTKNATSKNTIPARLVELTTDYGNITLKLYDSTPLHRDNFIKLVKEGFYDSLLFHRVIDSFS